MRSLHNLALLSAIAATGACGPDGPARDASSDLGPKDAGASDADLGPEDTGFEDLGLGDAGSDGGLDSGVDGGVDAGAFPERPNIPLSGRPPRLLSETGLVRLGPDGHLRHHPSMVAYTLNAPLFSDFAIKDRAIYVPEGETIHFTPSGALDFPLGSVIVKSFSFAPDLRTPELDRWVVETRLLIKQEIGWRAYPYLWREDQSDADYHVRGDVRTLEFIGPDGAPETATYLVPQKNQCLECHVLEDDEGEHYQTIIGPTARSMNRSHTYPEGPDNQLAQLEWRGMLEGLPPLDQVDQAFDVSALVPTSTRSMSPASIERAARDYLDANCAHCHNPRGVQGITSRLFLNWDNQVAFNFGVCKEPGSAGGAANGRKYDVVPGRPESSILWYRTVTEEVGDMMPLIGRSLSDPVGAALIRAWIEQMDLPPCD